jgi:hypothetical protein
MVINAVCQNCKRVYPLDEQYAGQTFSCETCGQPFTVPTPGVVQPIPKIPATPDYTTTLYANEISRDRKMASRICIALCVLGYIGFTCVGCAGILVLAARNPAAGVVSILAIIVAIFFGTIATTYLVCALRIRKGGHIAPIVALVFAILNGCGSVLLLISGIIPMIKHGGPAIARGPAGFFGYLIGLGIHLLFIVGVGQLIYHLIKILREPKGE